MFYSKKLFSGVTQMEKEKIILTENEQGFANWLSQYYMRSSRRFSRRTSYTIKHIYEAMSRIYIDNQQAKKVFHVLGYKPKARLEHENGNEQYLIKLKPEYKMSYIGKISIYHKKSLLKKSEWWGC